MNDPLSDARTAMRFAITVLEGEPDGPLGADRFRELTKRLDIVQGREAGKPGMPNTRELAEAQAAMMAVRGFVQGRGPTSPLSREERQRLRTRLQNALDGLPTQLGGEPHFPRG